ncbi:hypothetical protein DENIS_0213 [Desulfonema ishimotonii]|uniref:DUF3754 domain-containing protein n=1 Tax=Desulfonema ishimotonii TaxID=45657 RepID=A0A401FQN0_9BACT|nr:TMEM143 family protein [Desulfonema ishimotonii]GBC59277.1 hypothetical protein DENIS_0213 [Desulfonema ishimotonii]
MAQYQNRNRFIPFRKADIIEMCLADSMLPAADHKAFREFCHILECLFHFEFHRQLETLKDNYAPFNPDADTRHLRPCSTEEKQQCQQRLVAAMTDILKAGNFRQITESDLQDALSEESLFKIRLEVDFDDFEEIIFYCRGESRKEEIQSRFFGLRKAPFTFTNYERVVVYLKFREAGYFEKKKRKNLCFTPGSTVIKLFRNVPKADLEMLFPNSEVRMKPLDKLLIGVPAAVSGVIVLMTKLSASLLLVFSVIAFWLGLSDKEVVINQQHLIVLGAGLGTLGGYIFKQINTFKNRKIRFMKALADSLYFKNLDNNAGVFFHLTDAAEEEEFKEAVLAYYFLLAEDRDFTKPQLDNAVEEWLDDLYDCRIDFEIEDALGKLERLGLVERDGAVIRPKNLEAAKAQLDQIWDNYFTWHRPVSSPETAE